MKAWLINLVLATALFCLSVQLVFAQKAKTDTEDEPQRVHAMVADPGVIITMCIESGNIVVLGGDRREVRVTAEDADRVTLRSESGSMPTTPAKRIEVVVTESSNMGLFGFGDCRGTGDLDLQVPRGAIIYVKTRDGDIEISDVAEVRAETTTGGVGLMRIAKAIEASTVAGDVSIEDSNGPVRLNSMSGNLEAIRTRATGPSDLMHVKTISGDIRLEQIAQQRIEAGTITGDIMLNGPLAPGGFYDFKTTTGDVTVTMPANVSFRVTAKVSEGGEVITDFPLKYSAVKPLSDAMSSGKLAGSYGTGEAPATLNIVSFNGTLRLHKK